MRASNHEARATIPKISPNPCEIDAKSPATAPPVAPDIAYSKSKKEAARDVQPLIQQSKKYFYPFNAFAPLTISNISFVIDACLALLYSRRRAFKNSVALSVALCIAVIRAPCSEATDSRIAL